MVAHDHYGVDRIVQFSADAEAVCQFRRPLIIRPVGMFSEVDGKDPGNVEKERK